jgi:hypothetical protein
LVYILIDKKSSNLVDMSNFVDMSNLADKPNQLLKYEKTKNWYRFHCGNHHSE